MGILLAGGDEAERTMAAGTVLVVDDDPDILEFLRAALQDEGYRVLTAVDGEALPAARRERPDVILLDLRMLGMDGVEISQRLHDSYETAGIPIIVMSTPDRLKALGPALPVADWLPKPIELERLYDTVGRWMTDL